MSRKAVVLFNLGGPDSLQAVKPFLFNLFNDPNIINAPKPIRYLLAKIISGKREKLAQEIYKKIGGKSPILELTLQQAEKLKTALNTQHMQHEHRVFVCMRHWHPMTEEVVSKVKEYDPDEIVLLPLYPQFSTTTTGSSIKEWKMWTEKLGLVKSTTEICCYPVQSNFIRAHAAQIREVYNKAKERNTPRIIFSAHGLPEKVIRSGDPYQWQVEQTVEKIVRLLNIKDLDHVTAYQSRVGPMKWIGPSTDEEIIKAAEDGGVAVMVAPVAFVSEHSETLVELDIEYRALAERYGLKDYFRVPALGISELYIEALKELCYNEPQDICAGKFGKCWRNS